MSILNHASVQIPDEAVHAALLSMAKDNVGTDVQGLLMHGSDKLRVKPNALRNALTAAHPHLSAPCTVEIQKLHWINPDEENSGFLKARSVFGNYYVFNNGGWQVRLYDYPNGQFFEWSSTDLSNDTEQTAIDAAQADFERRILSCVVTNPVDVAAVREALSETRIDLVIFRGNIADAEKTDGRWDGMPDRVQSWIDRIDTALALSPTEPVQGEKWQPIETVPKDGIEFIARCGADKPSFSCFWDGTAFMHFDHGEGLISYSPTEWMPLPTSPNTEVGKCN